MSNITRDLITRDLGRVDWKKDKYNVYEVESCKKNTNHEFIKRNYSYIDTIQQRSDFYIKSNVHKQKAENKIEWYTICLDL